MPFLLCLRNGARPGKRVSAQQSWPGRRHQMLLYGCCGCLSQGCLLRGASLPLSWMKEEMETEGALRTWF